MLQVTDYAPRHRAAFKALNVEWIETYFTLEAKDREVLDDPDGNILAKGGLILMIEDDGEAVGCCALLRRNAHTYELAKMAVSPRRQGQGAGRLLIEAAIAHATALGATRLYLESNARLAPAIRLYESAGFRHLSPEERPATPYSRCDIYMERPLQSASDSVDASLAYQS